MHHEPEVLEILVKLKKQFLQIVNNLDEENRLIKHAALTLTEAFESAYVSQSFYEHQMTLLKGWTMDKLLIQVLALPVKEKAYKDYNL